MLCTQCKRKGGHSRALRSANALLRVSRTKSLKRLLLKRIAQTDLGQVAKSLQNVLCERGPRDSITRTTIPTWCSGWPGAVTCTQKSNANAMATLPGINNKLAWIDNAGVVVSTFLCEATRRNTELNWVVNGQLHGVDPARPAPPILRAAIVIRKNIPC